MVVLLGKCYKYFVRIGSRIIVEGFTCEGGVRIAESLLRLVKERYGGDFELVVKEVESD